MFNGHSAIRNQHNMFSISGLNKLLNNGSILNIHTFNCTKNYANLCGYFKYEHLNAMVSLDFPSENPGVDLLL